MAPIEFAVPIAAKPATPAPITYTFAGGIFPAAVTCPVKSRPKAFAASITARYPPIFAIEDNTSMDCAREIRGTASIDTAVTPLAFMTSAIEESTRGARREISTVPCRNASILSAGGLSNVVTMSACQTSCGPATSAPASRYCWSG